VIDPIGKTVARELGRFGPATGMARIVEAWPFAVGPEIARNAWPARLGRDGSLRVHTTDSVWAFELGTRAAEIRERLGELAPRRLVFAAGPLPEPPVERPEESRSAGVVATPEHYEEATPLVRGIRDENLRKIVAKTIATGLAAARSGRSFW
jgi:Dna[CI] antecedent, DciA